jgi:hypothetical protein
MNPPSNLTLAQLHGCTSTKLFLYQSYITVLQALDPLTPHLVKELTTEGHNFLPQRNQLKKTKLFLKATTIFMTNF